MDTEELKATVYFMVAKIIEERTTDFVVTPTFIASLVELVYNQLVNFGQDLELFANHAGRNVILPKDLAMVVRKNDKLLQILSDLNQELKKQP